MEYTKLFLGITLIIVFTWLLFRNMKRSSLLHSLLRIDTILGLIAGLYLVTGFIYSILQHG
jgi:uncharacterized membrane protein